MLKLKGKKTKKKIHSLLDEKDYIELIDQVPEYDQLVFAAKYDPVIWSKLYIGNEKGEELDYVDRPYLIDILSDFHPTLRIKKGAQVGITQANIQKILFVADNNKIAVIYTFPTKTDVFNFSKARFSVIVRNSRYLQSRMRDYDNASTKQIGDSTIYFSGTFNDRQAISIPSDINVHDELDFSDQSVREVYSARLSVSKLAYQWDFSTPTLPGYGIDALYKDSDQHVWIVTCQHCRRKQQINFFKNISQSRTKGYFFSCRKCNKEIDRRIGKWVAKNPKSPNRGYFVPQTICHIISANVLMREYKQAPNRVNGMKTFYNFRLGETYESGEQSISETLVRNHVVAGSSEKGDIFMGIDQGDIFHCEVTKIVRGRRVIIFIARLHSFQEIRDLYAFYSPKVAVLDALPNHHNAQELANELSNLYLAYYKGDSLDVEELTKHRDDKIVNIPRTEGLDATAQQWNTNNVVIEDHIDNESIKEFVKQMAAMKRDIIVKPKGTEVAQWINTGSDHFRHADLYNYIAERMTNKSFSDHVEVAGRHAEFDIGGVNIFTASEIW